MNELDGQLFDFLFDEDTLDFTLFSSSTVENCYLLSSVKSESENEDITSSATSETTKSDKTSKRVYKPRSRVYIPKLVKNDIRNLYSSMFANVLNCQDYGLWAGYFNTYFHKNLVLQQEFSISHPKAPKSLEIRGSALCCDFLYLPMQGSPDTTIRVSDIKIRMPSAATSRDSDSIIIANFVLESTEILDVPMETFVIKSNNINSCGDPVKNETSQPNDSESTSAGDGRYIINYTSQEGKQGKIISYNVEKYQEILNNAPMLSAPMPTIMTGSFVMHVDKNKMLTKLEFNYHHVDCAYWQDQLNKAFGDMTT